MQLVVKCNREGANHFFRTNIEELAGQRVSSGEIDYLADALTETALVGTDQELQQPPWFYGDAEELARVVRHSDDELLLREAEMAANSIMVREGIITRGIALSTDRFTEVIKRFDATGTLPPTFYVKEAIKTRKKRDIKYRAIATALYGNAARLYKPDEPERFALRRIALHLEDWVDILAMLPGWELLKNTVGIYPKEPTTV